MRSKITLALTLSALLLVGAGCAIPGVGGGGGGVRIKPVSLEYWRVDDDPAAMQPIIDAYKKIHPNVEIKYTRFRADDYETKLLEAFAENRGPDMFSIPNTWLTAWEPRIQPIPKQIVIPTQTVTPQKTIVTAKVTNPGLSVLDMRNDFVEGVNKEVIRPFLADPVRRTYEDRVWALPLSFDTLGMYYNKDLLKKANIEKPPLTWTDVQNQAQTMTILDKDGNVKQAGAALGGGKNVWYATDILAAIMSQNGADLADDNGYVRFSAYTEETRDHPFAPGTEALMYYQSYANKGTPAYTWNEDMPVSIDAFVSGTTAFYFGLPSDIWKIRERAPKLDFGIAALPQIDPSRPKNIADFPVEVVSKKTVNVNEAWDFLEFATSKDQVQGWLTAVKRPTALRSLINPQLTDPDISPFVGQALTAHTWYKGYDWATVEDVFAKMILARPTVEEPEYQRITDYGAQAVDATLRPINPTNP